MKGKMNIDKLYLYEGEDEHRLTSINYIYMKGKMNIDKLYLYEGEDEHR